MEVKKLFVPLFVCMTAGLACAGGWETVKTEQLKNETVTELSGSGGRKARVVAAAPLSPDDTVLVGNCLDAVWALPGLEAESASVRMDDTGFRFVVYPLRFVFSDTDFVPFIPSGLAFYYKDTLFYDIMMKVGDFMPRVAGAYVSPDGLLNNLYAATIMPNAYLGDASVSDRLARLEAAVMAVSKKGLFSKPSAVSSAVVQEILLLYNENPSVTPKEALAALKEKGIKASKADVEAVFIVLLGILP